MSPGKPLSFPVFLKAISAGIFITWLGSCSVVPKNYPRNQPFVYEYNIKVEGNFTRSQKNELQSALENQLDDSIRVRTARKFFYHGINTPVLDKPPLFESSNATESINFMKRLLNLHGYFKDTITYDTVLKIVNNDQYRTTVNFNVFPGKLVRLDSISYHINQPELQQITLAHMKDSYLHKDGAFATDTISYELDRLVELYRNNGYMRFSRDELIGSWDTLDVAMLEPSLDPFEQLNILKKLSERREHPKANLDIRLRQGVDTTRLTKYYIGSVSVYPENKPEAGGDSVILAAPIEIMADGIKVVYFNKVFKPTIIPENIYLRPDSLYRHDNYLKTISRFNTLGAWRLVNIEPKLRPGKDTVDFTIYLSPAKKYSFTTNLEGSRNQSAISGNLFGLAVNAGVQNRNFAKAANQATTNIRYGIETGRDTVTGVKFTQTRQLSFSHIIYFPHPIPNSKWIPAKFRDNFRTVFSFTAANTERRELYNLTTVNGSWGYELQWKNKLFSIKIPNIEYSYLKRRPLLDSLFLKNPSLKNIFTDGFISSVIGGLTISGGQRKNINLFRANLEESGLVAGLIKSKFLDTNLYRFIKIDAEFVRKIVYRKSSLALRLFAGMGFEMNSTVNPDKKNNLPFFKQYFGGGPNSMRAWALRRLGPGSVINDVPERYGDVQIEANAEYRFPIAVISGVKVNGALFTDIGNVWFLKKEAGLAEQVFNFNRLGKDIAVGVGTGVRIDFSFLVVRLDYSYKAKDPSPKPIDAAGQNKWFYNWKPFGGQLQLGISYPFIL